MASAAERATAGLLEAAKQLSIAPGATQAYRDKDPVAYALSQVSLGTSRPLKVIVIGAGLSGLAFAKAVESGTLTAIDLTIYEKNSNVGGTWFENRYPGCACDIPAHNYQFSWAPNPHWKSFYAGRDDIMSYVEALADQHDLRKYVKTSHKVTNAGWNESKQRWIVTVCRTDGREIIVSSSGTHDGETSEVFVDECDVLINCCGFFNNWKWPAVSGRQDFQGRMIHSAAWPEDGDSAIDGKTVAIIGNGSSGIQILPAILNRAKKVYVHARSPTWVTTGLAEKFAGPGGSNLVFSEEQKQQWADNLEEYLQHRKTVEGSMSSRFRMYMAGSDVQTAARKFSTDSMTAKLTNGGRVDLVDLFLPDFAVGCRRPTPGNGYLEALCSDKCEVVWGGLGKFTQEGILSTNGTESKADTIICATGFDLSCTPRFPIIGRGGANLQKRWASNPESYLSVTVADMPNYMTYLGPASPLGHGSLTPSIEFVTHYVCDLIRKLQTQNYSSLCPKPYVARAYQKHALAWMDQTVWVSNCSSTFKNGSKDGKVLSLHPGSRLHYFQLLKTPRYEDFDWTSICPDEDLAFAWLADGFTMDEDDPATKADLTYFLNPGPGFKPIQRVLPEYKRN